MLLGSAEVHPLALFRLKPLNKNAENAVNHPRNAHLVTRDKSNNLGIDIGFHTGTPCFTIATLGREGDVFLEGQSISRMQCSFEIESSTNVPMIYDRSMTQSTTMVGRNSESFERERTVRRVLIAPHFNKEICIGRGEDTRIRFEIEWYRGLEETIEMAKNRRKLMGDYVVNPSLARTVPVSECASPSRQNQKKLLIRYHRTAPLGSGQFGNVWKAFNVDSGKLMAVKEIKQPLYHLKQTPGGQQTQQAFINLSREIETLSELKSKHPHIVDYIGSQGWDEEYIQIFMGLKDGNLGSLTHDCDPKELSTIAYCACDQMLQALDYLAVKGIVHRDVKPENILFESLEGGKYRFQLGDFGLCNRAVVAVTCAGTPFYMAPEMWHHGTQTHKIDVWSLFVTIAWTMDAHNFRSNEKQFKSFSDVHEAVQILAETSEELQTLQEMARTDPNNRATAAQILLRRLHGKGLTTPRDQILPLPDLMSWTT